TRHPPRATPSPYTTLFRSTLDQRYLILIQCNPALGYDGPTEFTTDLLSPGDQQFFNVVWMQSGGVPPATERNCQLTLFPGEVVRSEEHTSELQSRENLVCR